MSGFIAKSDEISKEVVNSNDEEVLQNLAPRHRVFVREYLMRGNSTMAAVEAGYKGSAARQAAHVLLKREDVIQAIQILTKKIQEKCEYSLEASIESQKKLYEECIRMKQMTAAVKAKEHLDILTKHYDPHKVHLDLGGKAPLSIQIFGIAPPAYAEREALDVTPQNEALTGKPKDK